MYSSGLRHLSIMAGGISRASFGFLLTHRFIYGLLVDADEPPRSPTISPHPPACVHPFCEMRRTYLRRRRRHRFWQVFYLEDVFASGQRELNSQLCESLLNRLVRPMLLGDWLSGRSGAMFPQVRRRFGTAGLCGGCNRQGVCELWKNRFALSLEELVVNRYMCTRVVDTRPAAEPQDPGKTWLIARQWMYCCPLLCVRMCCVDFVTVQL